MGVVKNIILNEPDRQKLDGIVKKMSENGESEDNIRLVVNDFKNKYGVKKKDSVGEKSTISSPDVSPLPSPLLSKSEKQNRDSYIEKTDAGVLISDYDIKSKEIASKIFSNPVSAFNEYASFSQSREGKVGKILTDINNGKLNKEDINYLSKVAPSAAKQVVKQILPKKDNNSLLSPETINEFIVEGTKVSESEATNRKVIGNSQNDVQTKQQISLIGINPSKILDDQYSEKVLSDLNSKHTKDLYDLDKEYPVRKVQKLAGNKFATYENVRDREKEYNAKKKQIEDRFLEIRNQLGVSAAYDYAKQNPSATPKEIGEQWYKRADPDGYKLWVKAGKNGAIDRDIAQVGVNALYGTKNGGAIELAKSDEKRLDYKFPDKKRAEVLHKLGAELYKDQNWFLNFNPSIKELDKAADQLLQEDREFYYKIIREQERKGIGTDVPMSGLVNKIGEGISSTGGETWKFLGDITGARSEKEQAADAINEGIDSRYQDVGDYQPAVQRLKQIKNKQKSGESLTAQEIEEKQNLERYTGVRSTAQEIIDGSGNLAGQVVFQALATKGLSNLLGYGTKAIGLLKSAPIASGLATEEAIAANALDFGISKAAINNITASGIAFASSYDAAKRDALRLMPDDKDAGKRLIYANIVGGLNAASERIFKDEKILDAFNREISPSVKSLASKLSSGNIEREALGSELSNILNKSKSFLKEAGKSNLQESTEEFVTSVGQSLATAILAPAKFNAQQAFDDAISTFTTTFLHGGLVAGMAGIHGYRTNHLGTPLLSKIGVDEKLTNDTKNFINAQVLNGSMSQEEANGKFKILNTAEKINRDVMPQVDEVSKLPQKAREKYAVQLLNEKILANNSETIEDPVLKSAIEKKIKESEEIRKGLINKQLFVDDNYSVKNLDEINAIESRELTDAEVAAIDSIQKKDFTGTGLKSYADVINDIKAKPEEKRAALQGIYDQLTAEGTEAEVGQLLGKDADFIYDLNYEKPQESEAVKEAKMPNRNDDFVSDRRFFSQSEEDIYWNLIDEGKEDVAKHMVLKRRKDILKGEYTSSSPTEQKESNIEDVGEEIVSTPEEDVISIQEVMDKPVTRSGERGVLSTDGKTVLFKPENSNKEYEIGNVDEITNQSIKDFGIEQESTVVSSNDDGSLTVRGKKYINPFEQRGQSPTDAILYDDDGNVVNVRLKTEDGKRRTFTGNVAEDLAYQISLKEITKDNETRERFEQFINEDESAKSEISDEGFRETSDKEAVKTDENIQTKENQRTEQPIGGKVGIVEVDDKRSPNEAAEVLQDSYDRLSDQMRSEEKDPLSDPEMNALLTQIKNIRKENKNKSTEIKSRNSIIQELSNELRALLGESKIYKLGVGGNIGWTVGEENLIKRLKELGAPSKMVEKVNEFAKIKYRILLNPRIGGYYYSERENEIAVRQSLKNNKHVIEHEVAHYLTVWTLNAYEDKKLGFTSKAIESLTESDISSINILYDYYSEIKSKTWSKPYGLTNLAEFVSEFVSNDKFRDQVDRALSNRTNKDKIWDYIKSIITSITGIRFPSSSNQEDLDFIKESIEGIYKDPMIVLGLTPDQVENGLPLSVTDEKPISISINDGFYTNVTSPVSFKEMGIKEGDSIGDVIDKAILYGGPLTSVLEAVKADLKMREIKLELLPSDGGNTSKGLYFPEGKGAETPNRLQIYDQGNVQYALAHELMHFFTLDSAAAEQIKESNSIKALEGFYNYLASNKGKPISGLATVENYGLTNFKEFMAELLINPTFRQSVSDVYANNYEQIAKTDKFIRNQKGGSIVDMIVNLFRDLINAVIGNKSNVDFNPSESVVDQAAKLMTDLFFGGQDVTKGQQSGEGKAIMGKPSEGEGPLAIGEASKNDIISEFVKKKISEGIDEGIIREVLEASGISPSESASFIESAKPKKEKSFTSERQKEQEVISKVLSTPLNERSYPTIFENNQTEQQLAARTQGIGQNREVDGGYVVALEDDLRKVSEESARVLQASLGENWGVKTLEFMEENPHIGRIEQVVGLLNVISTEVYQDLRNTHDTNKINRLKNLQNRIDIVSNDRARSASLGLRQRQLYTKFAQGEDIKSILSNKILSPEQNQLLNDLNDILSQPVSDEKLNSVKPTIISRKQKKKSSSVFGKFKRKASNDVKREIISKGVNATNSIDEFGNTIKKTFQDYIREANEKVKSIKC